MLVDLGARRDLVIERVARRGTRLVVGLAVLGASLGCEPRSIQPTARARAEPSVDEAGPHATGATLGPTPQTAPAASTVIEPEPAIVRFAWRPAGADVSAYAMDEPEDQHRIVIIGRGAATSYPVLIALHGQPKRAERPRDYSFPKRVIDVTTRLVRDGEVEPLVLALPVFRFRGLDWPAFDLVAFRAQIEKVMAAEGLTARAFYVVGHSGAAGCGGDGMNRAHRMHPSAVGFFDTCLGSGWRDEIRALEDAHVPTSIFQSVETAGVQPRNLREYDGRYDFEPVFHTVGLAPTDCPARVPDAPLRPQSCRCAAAVDGLVRAFVVDTGQGEEAHNALVSVALSYFLREHFAARR